MTRKRHPFGDKHDPKLALLRRADTERDSKGFSLSSGSGRKRGQFTSPDRTPSLARLNFMKKNTEDNGS